MNARHEEWLREHGFEEKEVCCQRRGKSDQWIVDYCRAHDDFEASSLARQSGADPEAALLNLADELEQQVREIREACGVNGGDHA